MNFWLRLRKWWEGKKFIKINVEDWQNLDLGSKAIKSMQNIEKAFKDQNCEPPELAKLNKIESFKYSKLKYQELLADYDTLTEIYKYSHEEANEILKKQNIKYKVKEILPESVVNNIDDKVHKLKGMIGEFLNEIPPKYQSKNMRKISNSNVIGLKINNEQIWLFKEWLEKV